MAGHCLEPRSKTSKGGRKGQETGYNELASHRLIGEVVQSDEKKYGGTAQGLY